ncbi:hypothetical protein NMG29_08170 [Streptomyces cocklensis]|jgi:hypothetical protein|uniref:Uncharacterized protein n=1 Tax=Actinacidiphila cocklensis TaxID=887465 RepID=A0A9W4GQG7_9ACTN|nr:hypothetical protein [Actinacidiphila cocklensis]MDD1058202.1 hypothetical protein [Actinacidiphila cocklensis]CAG6393253.1 conserved hypothetical protein [Actinacidiphila cocklensis]
MSAVRLALGHDGAGDSAGEAADLAAFLGRLVRWDKAAVVRLRSAAGEPALGVFGHPPFGGVLAVRSTAVRGADALAAAVDATVSAGQLLEAVSAAAEGFELPPSVTGPAWAGLLPPQSGWQRVAEFDPGQVRKAAVEAVAEFRARTEALPEQERTRAALDALAEELWTRPYQGTTLRVVHAAHALGFLRGDGDDAVALLAAGPWTRLRTGYGSVAVRRESAAAGLSFSPA